MSRRVLAALAVALVVVAAAWWWHGRRAAAAPAAGHGALSDPFFAGARERLDRQAALRSSLAPVRTDAGRLIPWIHDEPDLRAFFAANRGDPTFRYRIATLAHDADREAFRRRRDEILAVLADEDLEPGARYALAWMSKSIFYEAGADPASANAQARLRALGVMHNILAERDGAAAASLVFGLLRERRAAAPATVRAELAGAGWRVSDTMFTYLAAKASVVPAQP